MDGEVTGRGQAWTPTREEGLRRLEEFLPRAGRDYATWRNHDHGPGDRSNVSTLSPYIRHRLILEEEVAAAVVGRWGAEAAEKFLQEVCWRTYWKGWLELRPGVWGDYQAEAADLIGALDRRRPLRDRWEAATQGRTGIDGFDDWARELVETGYLHNHARMWFASIWIFTLKLPWALGADFFLRHLLDGDPASNTLSWRWVAGLQTRGKTYLARAENIARYTSGRFQPDDDQLAAFADPIEGPAFPRPRPLPAAVEIPAGPVGLLLTEEDLEPSSLGIPTGQVAAIAGVLATADRSPLPVGGPAVAFASGALDDALKRAGTTFDAPAERLDGDDWAGRVADWAARHGVNRIVTPYAPVGPVRERLDRLAEAIGPRGLTLVTIRRAWDGVLWPFATSGFFPFKEKIPASLDRLGIGTRSRPRRPAGADQL